MKILNNINDTVRDDLLITIEKGSKISIAAACFSIYAYQELKKQLEGVDQLRVTIPDKPKSAKQQFVAGPGK